MSVRPALFWDVTQRELVVRYRRFGTSCRSHLQAVKLSWIGSLLSTFRDQLSVPFSQGQAVLCIGSLLSTFRDKLSVPFSQGQAVLCILSLLSTFRDKLLVPSSSGQAVLRIGSLLPTFRDKLSTVNPRCVKSPKTAISFNPRRSLKPNARKWSTWGCKGPTLM